MYILTINNKEQVTAHDKTLITFLRDDLRLTGTKDIRGADRVLVDGVPTAARDVRVSALRGRHITTREGADEAMLQLHSLGDPRQYADDINVPRQVYVRPIFGCPGGTITGIDMTRALENARFGDCIQKADIPGTFGGIIGVGETVATGEDVVALMVSTYLHELDALCDAISVRYAGQTCPQSRPVPDIPECATAVYHDDDTLTVYSNGDDPDELARQCADALNIPQEQITCVCTPLENARVGRAEVFAALTAWLTQQPAKVKF